MDKEELDAIFASSLTLILIRLRFCTAKIVNMICATVAVLNINVLYF